MAHDATATRRRRLEAADELFSDAGVRAVGVERIAEKAGVTKRTLYYHFRSKDDLIAAYLAERDAPTTERYRLADLPGHPARHVAAAHMSRQLIRDASRPGSRKRSARTARPIRKPRRAISCSCWTARSSR
jgi:AcrR family transcriptional regulator